MSLCAVLEESGLTYRRLDYWTCQGLLKATAAAPGSGYPRAWEPAEIAVAARMSELVAAGLSLRAAHHAARNGGVLPGGVLRVVDEEKQRDKEVAS